MCLVAAGGKECKVDMKFQFLISTMNNSINNIVKMTKESNTYGFALVINQASEDLEFFEDENIKVYSYNEKGLSKSRNRAIENSDADICLICDDDIIYHKNIGKKILNAFEANPNYDLIAFYVNRSKDFHQKKQGDIHQINFLQSMAIMSVQIAFKRESVIKKKIKFDEKFGAGSDKYICGEENIFLTDCLRNGLKILYVPIEIAKLTETDSTWFTGYNELYFKSKGAVFYRMSKIMYIPLIVLFAFLKRKMYSNEATICQAMKYMKCGCKEYKEKVHEDKIY